MRSGRVSRPWKRTKQRDKTRQDKTGKSQDRTFCNPKRRRKPRLEIYKLVDCKYELQDSNPFWMSEIGLGIGSERASYDRLTREWLYWYDENNRRYPNPDEQIEQERQRAVRAASLWGIDWRLNYALWVSIWNSSSLARNQQQGKLVFL
jgi:hypothetical protein